MSELVTGPRRLRFSGLLLRHADPAVITVSDGIIEVKFDSPEKGRWRVIDYEQDWDTWVTEAVESATK